jgi:primosomal protein N' (replication factor Y)
MNNPLAFLVLDDGDDLLTSLQAPYWTARDVLAWRADLEGVPLILVSRARSIEVSFLVESQWATAISVDRQSVRENSVKILTTGDDFDLSRDEYAKSARIPEKAFKSIQKGIAIGSVLIVTPRRGYLAVIACASCKEIVRCTNCQAPMAVEKTTKDRSCRRCGKLHMSLELRSLARLSHGIEFCKVTEMPGWNQFQLRTVWLSQLQAQNQLLNIQQPLF